MISDVWKYNTSSLQRRKTAHQTCALLQSLSSILTNHHDDSLQTISDKGQLTFPESNSYGQFLDEESWLEWQMRYHQDDSYLSHDDSTSRLHGYRASISGKSGESETTKVEGEEKNDEYFSANPCILKELEWRTVADKFEPESAADEVETLNKFGKKHQIFNTFTPKDRISAIQNNEWKIPINKS